MDLQTIMMLSALPQADAERIATLLVEERLVACVNLTPVTSVYRWKGAVEREGEVMAMMKTTRAREEAVRERLCALHPYEVPEVITFEITGGHLPYLNWIAASVAPETP